MALDLDEIRARLESADLTSFDTWRDSGAPHGKAYGRYSEAVEELVGSDVQALIDEVEQLRASLSSIKE